MYVASRIAEEQLGVCANTLRKWADTGKIKYIRTPSGQRRYDTSSVGESPSRRKICYCRVSSYKQKDDLERQIAYMRSQFPNHEIIKDIGSGINFKRKGLLTILESISSGDVEQVVVAHRDRLARFGFELIEWLATQNATELLVLEESSLSPAAELTQDLLSILHVFSCRVHGMRKYGKAIKEDKDLPDSLTTGSSEEVGWDGAVCLQSDDCLSETAQHTSSSFSQD